MPSMLPNPFDLAPGDGLPPTIHEVDSRTSSDEPAHHTQPQPRPPPALAAGSSDAGAGADARRVRFSSRTISDADPVVARPPAAPSRGPTVTVRAPPSVAAAPHGGPDPAYTSASVPVTPPEALPSPSLRRRNHPGPLGLADRIPGYRASPLSNAAGPHNAGSDDGQANAERVSDERQSDETVDSKGPSGRKNSASAGDTSQSSNEKQAAEPDDDGEEVEAPLAGLSAHELDQRGLNGQAIVELRQQLEAIEAGDRTSLRSVSELARQSQETSQPAESAEPSAPVSGATSGTATPSEGSYNPLEDSDLEHIPIVPGEVDGMPAPLKHSEKEEGHEIPIIGLDVEKVEEGVKSALGRAVSVFKKLKPDGNESDDPEKLEEGRADADNGGPTNTKSVPVHTSTGLRGTGKKPKPSRYERQAARLVKSHRLMMGLGGGTDSANNSSSDLGTGLPAGDMLHPDKPINTDHLPSDSNASTPDAVETATKLDARPVQQGGVLGNLLMLYEQQQREQQAALKSAVSGKPPKAESEISTEPKTAPSSELGFGETSKPPSSLGGPGPTAPRNPFGIKRLPFSRANSAMPSPTSTMSPSEAARRNRLSEMGKGAQNRAASAAKDIGLEYDREDRPRAARSSAGVAGALVATSGNLVGAVSPLHAQLGPNPFRQGFTLDRYLLPEMNAKTLRRTAKIIAQASGPANRQRGAPTPGGAITPGGDRLASGATTPGGYQPMPPGGIGGLSMASTPTGDFRRGSYSKRSIANTLSHPGASFRHLRHHSVQTPDASDGGDYFASGVTDKLRSQQKNAKQDKERWQRQVKKRAKRTKKEEIFITLHVAAILQRQEFLLKLARALMMFGAPTHRIETQIQATARVLEVNCRCVYFPSLMLVSFADDMTHTSDTRFIKQPGGTDLARLTDLQSIYWNTIHDKIGVDEASRQLDELMRRKPLINRFWMMIIGALCSAMICAGPMGFNGSFVDCLLAAPLGGMLVLAQSTIKAELFSNVFEIVFAGLNSFLAAAAYQNGTSGICYAAVTPASIVLILPGMMFLQGSLELQSKAMISGSVRLVYGFLYSLFLGFGLSVGAVLWTFLSGQIIDTSKDTTCQQSHNDHHWYFKTIGIHYAFLCVPAYAICLSLRNYAKPTRKEFVVMVIIAIGGWCVNHFSGKRKALQNRQDFTAMLGSLAVGIASTLYGALFDGRSFVVAVTGILYLLPSGWSGGGLLNFANTNYTHDNSSTVTASSSISSGFQVAEGLLSVAIGLSVGLFAAALLSYYLLGGKRGRGGGMFSF